LKKVKRLYFLMRKEGKMIEELRHRLNHEDPEIRRQVLNELRRQKDKPSIIPILIECLEDENWRVRKTIIEILLDIGDETVIKRLISLLYHRDANARNSAIEALVQFGSKATDYLIEEFGRANTEVKKFIIDILGSTGDLKAFPLLMSSLDEEDKNVKASVIEHLAEMPANTAVTDALVRFLECADEWVAYHAAEALGRIGDARAVDALISVLPCKGLRKPAIKALGQIADVNSIRSIIPFLNDESRSVREEAVKALAQFFLRGVPEEVIIKNIEGTFKDRTLDLLRPFTQSNTDETRIAAILLSGLFMDKNVIPQLLDISGREEFSNAVIKVLVFMGRSRPEWLIPYFKIDDPYKKRIICDVAGMVCSDILFQHLIECLKDKDGHVRGNAATALSKLNNPEAIRHIKPLLLDEYENIQEQAILALSRFKKWLNLNEIKEGLSDKNPILRRNSAILLGLLQEEDSVEALGAALKDSDLRVRKAVVEALTAINGSKVGKFLLLALTDEAPEISRIAALAIGRMRISEGVEPLIALLHDTNALVRAAAAEALGNIGDTKAEDPLIQVLSDYSGFVRTSAIGALGKLKGRKAKNALLHLLKDEDAEIRSAALESLVNFDSVINDIVPLLKDKEWIVRKKVVDILGTFFKDESYNYLKEIAQEDEDLQVRRAAEGYING
jgi:HEAT repeat protein